jgi:hypothetical protein
MGERTGEAQIKITVGGNIYNTSGLNVSTSIIGAAITKLTLESGIEADEFNRAWQSIDRTLASGASETLDLYDFATLDIGGGAGNDVLGQALTMEEIVCLVIVQEEGPGRLEINETPPANVIAWLGSHTVANGGALKAGGVRLWLESDADALDITDASSHKVTFKANGGAVTYSIYILGRHDDNESSSSSLSSSSSSSSSRSSSSRSSSSSVSSLSSSSSSP